jgi:hypothetical protein
MLWVIVSCMSVVLVMLSYKLSEPKSVYQVPFLCVHRQYVKFCMRRCGIWHHLNPHYPFDFLS